MKNNPLLAALTAIGIMAVFSTAYAAGPSFSGPRTDSFDYSMCADFMMVGAAAPISKLMSYGTPIVLPATYMCECVKYQVGPEAREKITCPHDFITNGFL